MQLYLVDVYGKINLDLFMPEEYDFYRQYAIRTGSADWVSRFLATGWRKAGWVGTDAGLRRIEECENINEGKLDGHGVRMKPKWKCVVNSPTRPPFWKSEEEFFSFINLEYIEPKYRNV